MHRLIFQTCGCRSLRPQDAWLFRIVSPTFIPSFRHRNAQQNTSSPLQVYHLRKSALYQKIIRRNLLAVYEFRTLVGYGVPNLHLLIPNFLRLLWDFRISQHIGELSLSQLLLDGLDNLPTFFIPSSNFLNFYWPTRTFPNIFSAENFPNFYVPQNEASSHVHCGSVYG